jgi:hypothetical protein
MEKNEIVIDGKEYVLKSSIKNLEKKPVSRKGLIYAIVRSYSAGVFAGYVGRVENRQAKVYDARRLWFWDGAASLSQLSQEGVKKPQNCKFPRTVPEVLLTDIAEVIPATEVAKKSIDGVAIWQQ